MSLLEIFAKDNLCSVDGTGVCKDNMDFTAFVKSFGGSVVTSLFIIAGIIMMTSSGDPAKVGKAKKAITGAIIGLIISMSAFAITTAITSAFN